MFKEETERFRVKYFKEFLTFSNPSNEIGKIKGGYCSKKKPILQKQECYWDTSDRGLYQSHYQNKLYQHGHTI